MSSYVCTLNYQLSQKFKLIRRSKFKVKLKLSMCFKKIKVEIVLLSIGIPLKLVANKVLPTYRERRKQVLIINRNIFFLIF
jgi:hypothetical protein